MFNLTEIMQAAQSGQWINNIASQYGLSPQQAESAVQSVLPGLSMGLQNKAETPDGFASLLEMMTGAAHLKAFTAPSATSAPETVEAGKDVLGNIFGGEAAQQAMAQHAASVSGISTSIMNAMMPAIASMIMGGLFKGAANNGLGGLLSAANGGGMGNIFGQMMGGNQAGGGSLPNSGLGGGSLHHSGLGGMFGQMMQPQQNAAGAAFNPAALAGMFSQMMGQMMGSAATTQQAPSPTPIQAGLEMFQAMLNHGQQVHETHTNALQTIFATMVKGRQA